MSQISVCHLTFGYEGSDQNVFEDVSFTLDTDWRTGFIGRNGRGKTTFLQLLCGRYDCGGAIAASVPFDYFPFEAAAQGDTARRAARESVAPYGAWEREMDEALAAQDLERYQQAQELYMQHGGYDIDARLEREAARLGIEAEALERPFASLSGGERTKLLIAALFLRQGRFLLIDEPTNHLDAAGRRQLAGYLAAKKGFLLVSHDRDFLDAAVDHILSINRTGIEVQRGNYTSFEENRRRRESFEYAEQDRLKRDIAHLRAAARQKADWSDKVERSKIGAHAADRGFIGHKAAKTMKRAKTIEARHERAAQEKEALLRDVEEAQPLKLSPLQAPKDLLVEGKGLSIRYGPRELFGALDLQIRRGERVALAGGNGCGKTSLLRLILGEAVPHSGALARMSGLVISCVPQEMDFLRGDLSAFARAEGVDESLFKAILRKLGFSRAQFERDMGEGSDGQKKKILLARSLAQRAHLYVWDEPLNYIDLPSREQIETLLLRCRPTMLFVEHDAAFARRVATRTVSL